jgi:glycosyltransferase involved in cell wall biosynthesis
VVCDRQLVSAGAFSARLLKQLDLLSSSMADMILVDTSQNQTYWQDRFSVPKEKLRVVNVGAEDSFARPQHISPAWGPASKVNVLFYGKYAPLHGTPTIIRAAHRLRDHPRIQWTLVGKGQQRPQVDALAEKLELNNVEFIDWIPYTEIPACIGRADIGLGIFGSTGKAQRVVPNKAYQVLAGRRPLITGDTPAARDVLAKDGTLAARLVKPGDARELAAAVADLSLSPEDAAELAEAGFQLYRRHYSSKSIGEQVASICRDLVMS